MRFSLRWIEEFLDAPPPPEKSRALLDQAGLPVESVEAGEPGGEGAIFDVEITPNRPDAMSHRGLAREIAALSGTPLAATPAAEPLPVSGDPIDRSASVEIEVPRLCRRFGALLLREISAAPAPERVQARLSAIGHHPIGGAVDATNYGLWGLGQPLHAFDFDKLRGGKIVVRKAKRGETLVTLDGIERKLDPADVVVADAERAVSLAGVMGGLETAVTGSTKNVLLEAAWWDPVAIRRTSKRLGMHTDASHRFERGADPDAIPEALRLAADLILESSPDARLAPGMIDAIGAPFRPRRASLRLARLRLLAGDDRLSIEFAADALARLGFAVERRSRTRIAVGIPARRHDVTFEDDLVEEVLRVYGYDRLPATLPVTTIPGRHLEPRRIVEETLSDVAVAAGLFETVGYPFVDPADERPFAPWLAASGVGKPLAVSNPLDETRRFLRATLLPGLLDAAGGNARRGRREAALFEVGRVFGRLDGDPSDPPSLEGRRFAFALAGDARTHWSEGAKSRPYDFFDAKGLVERLVESWLPPESLAWSPAEVPGFARGACAVAAAPGGAALAVVGLVSREERERRSLPETVFAAEISVDGLPARPRKAAFVPYSAFPPVESDLTFAHTRDLAWDEIARAIAEARLAHLESARVADRFERAAEERTKSTKTTVRLTFRAPDRTLAQDEVNAERDRLARALVERFAVEI
jgi:phenylalanyl-tRNA synthetase beta chain